MSFITQCPACETQFKVTPDQLKMSEGWVRCGHCQHVFDASLNLQPWWPEPEEPAQAPPPPAEQDLPDTWSEPEPTVSAEQPHDAVQEPRFDIDSPVQEATTNLTEPSFTEDARPQEPLAPQDRQDPAPLQAADDGMRPTESETESDVRQEPSLASDGPAPMAADTQPVPSFIQRAMEKAYWHRTSVRLALYLIIAVLLLVLGVQWFYRHKDDWAANQPQLRPVLQATCAVLRCQIEVPRKLSEVVIDSSSFVRGQTNRFDFQLMLRNRAEVEVAMPTLELTLTDIENQVIARRVIPPTEWPDQPTSMGPQATWALQLELLLDVPPTQIVTGYQAELFYP